jgi:hypothetical protein
MALPKIHNLTVRVLIAAIVVGALVLGTGLRAQFSRPTFEVDSVKLNTYGGAAGNSQSRQAVSRLPTTAFCA